MKEIIQKLQHLKQKIDETWQRLDLDQSERDMAALEKEMQASDFWKDAQGAQEKMKEADAIREELSTWKKIRHSVDDLLALAQESEKNSEDAMKEELNQGAQLLEEEFGKLEFAILLSGKYDKNNAIVAIHAGTGGVDAQDWAHMLMRMLLRFCEKNGWTARIVHESKASEAGIKSVTIDVKGRYAYGYLQSEAGVHRLVRISPFDAEAMRHTSFALVEILPEIGEIGEVPIKDEDIEIDVFRAGGHGGQSVNTTDSAVRIRHTSTGIVVVCQNERSQHQNKAFAMKILRAKLHKLYEEQQQEEKQKIRGEYSSAEWGNQIRSYVLHPYKLVKDHRTKYESKNPASVLDGGLTGFMEAYLKWKKDKKS